MVPLLIVCLSGAYAAGTTETTVSDEEISTISTTVEQENSTTPSEGAILEATTTLPPKPTLPPFTIRVPPMEELPQSALGFDAIPPHLSDYVYEVKDGVDLQDIGAEESNHHSSVFIRFEPQKYRAPPGREVEVTSFVADSETALNMNVREAVADVKNRSGGADMISAFFVAPEDEVYGSNNLDRRKVQERGDVLRPERYTGLANSKTNPYGQNSLTNDILAPLQAAVSLSHETNADKNQQPILEKQMLKEMPVYKTTIEIQKSIPYEIKGGQMQPDKDEQQKSPQQYTENIAPPVVQPIMLTYQVPQYRTPVYYKYPTAMYYIPQGYIGNYIMRHSHENTEPLSPYLYRPRSSYYYLRYQPPGGSIFSQALQYPLPYSPGYGPQPLDVDHSLPPVYQDIRQYPSPYQDVKAIPAAYQDTKSVPPSAPTGYKDETNSQTSYDDVKDAYGDEKYTADPYGNEKPLADYQVVKKIPQVSYQDMRLLPAGSYKELQSIPVPVQHEPKHITNTNYQDTKNIPVTYQTIKVIPATYPSLKVNSISYPELSSYLEQREEDQNTLHSEQIPNIVKLNQVSQHPNQIQNVHPRPVAPFRPSQHVFSSVYPPYTYRVPLMMTTGGRGIHARSVQSKQLCVEYGGFKPPMVPSVQIDEKELPQQIQEKSAVVQEDNKDS